MRRLSSLSDQSPSRSVPSRLGPDLGPDTRFLSESECRALLGRLAKFATAKGVLILRIESSWTGNTRWARNQISTSGDVRNTKLRIARAYKNLRNGAKEVMLNQLDDALLKPAILRAERLEPYTTGQEETDLNNAYGAPFLTPKLFFDTTYQQESAQRAAIVQQLVQPTIAAGMLAAGYIEVSGAGRADMRLSHGDGMPPGRDLYTPYTMAQCSITVRDPQGTGSGWAGVSWNDWSRVDAAHLCAVALDKCLRSRNPVRLEPGRYTTILEPQAVFDFTKTIFLDCMSRQWAENFGAKQSNGVGFADLSATQWYAQEVTSMRYATPGQSPFDAGDGDSKIGERVIDERLTVTMDPMDPDLGFLPYAYTPVTWIQDGVLKALSYSREYAVKVLNQDTGGYPNKGAYKMTGRGAPTSIDEMIATTKRGLLVTRFWGIPQWPAGSAASLIFTGYTRDGVWLIENGKITKPVWNFRFTESPMFMLNSVEQIGTPQRVFNPDPEVPAVVPALKVRDFNFTSLSDAV